MSIIKKIFSIQKTEIKIWLGIIVSALIISLIWNFAQNTQASTPAILPQTLDQMLPDGQVLVPIELSNATALEQSLGDFALVDLFRQYKGRTQKIASNVRLVRNGELNSQFAVLTSEGHGAKLVAFREPLMAIIKNPKKLKKRSSVSRRIIIEGQ